MATIGSKGNVSIIKPSQLHNILSLAHRIGVTAFIWGPPGAGKTALVKAYADSMKLPLYVVHLSQMDTVDLKGIPALVNVSYDRHDPHTGEVKTVESHATAFFGPDFLPREKAVLFFDEANQALPAVLAAAQRIVLEGKNEGGWQKHPETLTVCAGNRVGDKTGVNVLPSAFDNRCMHVEVDVTGDTDLLHAYLSDTYSGTPEGIEALSYVIPYHGWKPDSVYKFDPNGPRNGVHGQPTWRTWEFETRAIIETLKAGAKLNDPTFGAATLGLIGTAVGTEFLAFTRVREKLAKSDPKLLIAGDSSWVPPTDVDVTWAFAGALAPLVNKKTYQRALEGIEAIRKTGRKDLTIVALRLVIRAYKDIVATPEFIKLSEHYGNVIGYGSRR